MTPALRDTLPGVWRKAVECVVLAEARRPPLWQRFTRVLIGDSTTILVSDTLANEFPGCGGSHGVGHASAKWPVIWDCLSGWLGKMSWEAGRQNDSTSAILDEPPPAGSLSIFARGYFSLDRFRTWQAAEAHGISRGISDLRVTVDGQTHDLFEWLAAQPLPAAKPYPSCFPQRSSIVSP